MINTPSQSFWASTASVLIQEHGDRVVDYCIHRMHALVEKGNKSEALVWIEIAFAAADLMSKTGSGRSNSVGQSNQERHSQDDKPLPCEEV